MAVLEKGHYHCIECGSLFESEIKDVRDQRCPVCGNPPTGKILAGTEADRGNPAVVRSDARPSHPARELHGVNKDNEKILEQTKEAQKKQRRGKVKRTKRKGKKAKKIWIMLGAWLVLMVLIIGLVKHFEKKPKTPISIDKINSDRARMIADAEAQKQRMVVDAAIPSCEKAMTEFLNAPSAASKAQYVYQGVKLSGAMARYYRNNPSFSSTRGNIRILRGELLDIPGQKSIGTTCQNSLGERFEAIFVNEESEWKIDWKSLVRYDAQSWALFSSGADGSVGEFRLYMRVREMDEDFDSEEMSIVFYKPGMYFKTEFQGLASMSVRVVIDSDLGKTITDMIAKSETMDGKDEYGLGIGELDPADYHRVRVKLRLHKKEGEETRMELVEVLANHWYGDLFPAAGESPADKDGE